MMTRTLIALLLLLAGATIQAAPNAAKPNILLVLTDDQGWADLSCHGNPDLKTPQIDAFAKQSIEFTRFYVSPVCAPTRASLMTGRYNFRSGVTDTWFGRSTMAAEEFTLAEALKEAGYTTGLFGKWHLGDTYPYRPEDQGFDEVLMHRGGGISQPSCPPGNSYFDPLLLHNGTMNKYSGYCMDIYTDAVMAFIEANKDKPFFAYLATNTPHSPLQVPDADAEPYRKMGLDEDVAKVYGMVANIDDNFGRLMKRLEALELAENTIVIFMSDNGPRIMSKDRYTGELRGKKTQVFEGGIHVPFFIRWPDHFKPGKKIETIAAHIDLMPTLLQLSQVPLPKNVEFDGISLLPLMNSTKAKWPNRTLFFQWHRGNEPALYRNFAAIDQQYKLVQEKNHRKSSNPIQFELYDLEKDPKEEKDLAKKRPETVEKLRGKYETWFEDVCVNGFEPSPAWIGTAHENPVVLTQQDRRDSDGWGDYTFYPDAFWPADIQEPGTYTVTLRLFSPTAKDGKAVFKAGEKEFSGDISKDETTVTLPTILLPKGTTRLQAWIEQNDKRISPQFVDIELVNNAGEETK